MYAYAFSPSYVQRNLVRLNLSGLKRRAVVSRAEENSTGQKQPPSLALILNRYGFCSPRSAEQRWTSGTVPIRVVVPPVVAVSKMVEFLAARENSTTPSHAAGRKFSEVSPVSRPPLLQRSRAERALRETMQVEKQVCSVGRAKHLVRPSASTGGHTRITLDVARPLVRSSVSDSVAQCEDRPQSGCCQSPRHSPKSRDCRD